MSFRDTQQSPPQGGGFVFGGFLSPPLFSQRNGTRRLTLSKIYRSTHENLFIE